MAETLTLEYVETIEYTKAGEKKHFYKAHFDGGSRKAIFFSESLKSQLDELKGSALEIELKAPKKEGQDPSIVAVSRGGTEIWSESRTGGGGRPLLTDEQLSRFVAAVEGGLKEIAAAITELAASYRAVGDHTVSSSAPLQSELEPPVGEGGQAETATETAQSRPADPGQLSSSPPGKLFPSAEDDKREKWLNELTLAVGKAFPGSPKLYEAWLKAALKRRGAEGTEDLDSGGLIELVQELNQVAAGRKGPANQEAVNA